MGTEAASRRRSVIVMFGLAVVFAIVAIVLFVLPTREERSPAAAAPTLQEDISELTPSTGGESAADLHETPQGGFLVAAGVCGSVQISRSVSRAR